MNTTYNIFNGIKTFCIIIILSSLTQIVSSQPILFSDFESERINATETFFSKLSEKSVENGQLTLRAKFPEPTSGDLNNSLGGYLWARDLSVKDAQTLELKVDLVDVSGDEAIVALTYFSMNENGLYAVLFDGDRISLGKTIFFRGEARFFDEPAPDKRQNVSISLQLTGVAEGVLLRVKVMDNDHPGRVLFERSVLDTDAEEDTVRTEDLTSLIDDPGRPLTTAGNAQLLIMQNTDGDQPEVWATFDNFTSEVKGPEILGIRRNIQIEWPAYETEFIIERAPTPNGPWQTVDAPITQKNGVQYLTIPSPQDKITELFRLVTP